MEQPLALLPPFGAASAHAACPPRGGRFCAAKFVLAGDRMVNFKVT
jgi:hypothetical protein